MLGYDLEYLRNKYIETESELQGIEEDRNKKPFMYFIFENQTNPMLSNMYISKLTGLIDLRTLHKETEEINSVLSNKREEREGDVILKTNIFGFTIISKNINKYVTKEFSFESNLSTAIFNNENTNFKIVGPNGEIIKDNVNWEEANQIYKEKVGKEKEKLINEFKLKL
jgi:hypothetical protein